MKLLRSIGLLGGLVCGLLWPCWVAAATTYTFPGSMPAGCTTLSSGNYRCGSLTLNYGDVITIASPKPAAIQFTGSFTTDTSTINVGGTASDLTLTVNGALTLGYAAQIKANITAGSVVDSKGNVQITGNVTSTAGNITLDYATTVSGYLSATGNVQTPQNGSVGGSVTASGSVTVMQAGTLGGGITAGSTVVVGQSSTVNGSVSAGSASVTVQYQARVTGDVTTTGAININQEAVVSGALNGAGGNVTLGFRTRVNGNITTSSGTINLGQESVSSACVQSTSSATITLNYQTVASKVCCKSSGTCTTACVSNGSSYAMPGTCAAAPVGLASFGISGTGAASTCTPQTLTITARDATGATLTSYTGTINLSTSNGRGDWSVGASPSPSGTLTPGASNIGLASYSFAAGDAGVVKLRLTHTLAQTLNVTVVDPGVSASSSTSAAIAYSDNSFAFAEDLAGKIAGTNVAVAGRPHDFQVSLLKKDPTTGSCGVATSFNGSRSLKLWRTDVGGSWTAPSVVSPALSVPASRPGSNNLTLSFSSGVASFNLATTDVGRYALNLDDDSGTFASSTISGSLSDLTVRPLAIAVSSLSLSGTANPAGSAATDAVFGEAGASFSATVAAYRWSAAADPDNNGLIDLTAITFSQLSSGGLAAGFNSPVTLSPVAGSQTPAGGTLGNLSNGTVSGFSGGSVTTSTLAYSEVGSFQLATSSVVTNYLGASGVNIDAAVFGAAGNAQTRVGRFVPAGFALSSPTITHRSSQACSPASTFTYLGEVFQLGFTLTAQNTAGAPTTNYTGAFAKLDFSVVSSLRPAGIGGSTPFKTGGRLQLGTGSGAWVNGVATGATLTAQVTKSSTTPDGPFDTAQFGISALDGDGVGMLSLNLDTDSPADGADVTLVGTISLRHGRLRLQNALGAANRALKLPLTAQYWNGSAFVTNTLDSCTRVTSRNLSAGNLRKQLLAADIVMSPASVTVSGSSPSYLTLAAPGAGRVGTVDVALALGSASTDASCLASSWASKTTTASSGANLDSLRHTWCGSSSQSDPSARATWGLYRGSDGVVFQRENY